MSKQPVRKAGESTNQARSRNGGGRTLHGIYASKNLASGVGRLFRTSGKRVEVSGEKPSANASKNSPGNKRG